MLITSLTVFVALTAFFAVLIARDVKSTIKIIAGGIIDEELIKTRKKSEAKPKNRVLTVIAEIVLPAFFEVVVTAAFIFSLSIKINEKKPVGSMPALKVVESGSMSFQYEKNEYLVRHDLNDRIQRFDLIAVCALPPESELNLYDVVMYESEGYLIIHRIVGITEPDETHIERFFLLQGDANQYPDRFPVRYSQMKGIYRGTRIPFVGSFFIFMNSPAGWLCVLLVVGVCVAYPLVDKKLKKEIGLRFAAIDGQSQNEQNKRLFSEKNRAAENAAETVVTKTYTDGEVPVFIKPRIKTLGENYLGLSKEQKEFYDKIAAYAAEIAGSRQIINDRYEEYRYNGGRLVRIMIKRDVVTCGYVMINESFKKYVAGNKVKVKTVPITLKIADKNSLQAAKDSVDIAKKIIDDEKTYKKEQANLRRRERKRVVRSGNE